MAVITEAELKAVGIALEAYGELVAKLADGRWVSVGILELTDTNGAPLGYLDNENDDVYYKTTKEEML